MRELNALHLELDRVGLLLASEPDPTPLSAASVSGWSIAEQVDHLLKIVAAMLGRLEGEPKPRSRGINLAGRILFGIGRLPRGIGKSPEPVRGEAKPRAELLAALAAARQRLTALAERSTLWSELRPLVGHPYFGGLTPRQTLRFLAIHTDHHLRIVAAIRRAAQV